MRLFFIDEMLFIRNLVHQIIRKVIFRIAFLSFCCVSISLEAQVVNGSFEQNMAIPATLGQWQLVQGWNNAGSAVASPDYFHNNGTVATNLPETPYAIVDANQGNAMIGLMACGRPNTNIREYLSTMLEAPLIVGRKYLIGFKITNGIKTSTSIAGLGVDKLGLLFTNGPSLQLGQSPIVQIPQFQVDEVVYNAEWQSVNFIFEADQPYSHMTFGLFGTDADKNISIMEGTDPQLAYYFVDNFVMERIDEGFSHSFGEKEITDVADISNNIHTGAISDQPFFVPNTFTPNGDGDNEVFKPVANSLKEWEFEIFNKWGDRVFYTADENRGWDGSYNSLSCENGSYVWQVSYYVFNDLHEQKLVESRGIVNLVR